MTTGTRQYYAPGTATYAALSEIKWGKTLNRQVQDLIGLKDFIGPDKGEPSESDQKPEGFYPIVKKSELGKDAGDKLVVPLMRNLTGSAAVGNTEVVDTTYEEAMDFWSFNVWLGLARHATGWQNKLSKVRNRHLTKENASDLLAAWMAQYEEENGIIYALYNGYSHNVLTDTDSPIYSSGAVTHPNRYFGGDANSEDNVDESDVFNWTTLERMANWARRNNIRPCKIEGRSGFIAIVHPDQMYTLRRDPDWINAQLHAASDGKDNALFTRASGFGAGVYVYEHNKIANPPNTVQGYQTKRRAILLGAHSLAYAVGQEPEVIPTDKTDYGRLQNWCIEKIFGYSRNDYISDDGNSTKLNQSSSLWTTWADDPNRTVTPT